jgi:pyridoxamine 5'-phosphate oxidase
MNQDIAKLRRDYHTAPLHRMTMNPDPLREFEEWFLSAAEDPTLEANAMTLATADLQGKPSARVVLLKELDSRGFVFFTNYHSRKGRELDSNPQASLVFYWAHQHRQVRVEGRVERLEESASDAYYQSRPRGAQLGAWASQQSQPVASREELDQIWADISERFPDPTVPRPEHWGGYRLVPERLEFWQGRPDRNHDRIEYCREERGWLRQRLMP